MVENIAHSTCFGYGGGERESKVVNTLCTLIIINFYLIKSLHREKISKQLNLDIFSDM